MLATVHSRYRVSGLRYVLGSNDRKNARIVHFYKTCKLVASLSKFDHANKILRQEESELVDAVSWLSEHDGWLTDRETDCTTSLFDNTKCTLKGAVFNFA